MKIVVTLIIGILVGWAVGAYLQATGKVDLSSIFGVQENAKKQGYEAGRGAVEGFKEGMAEAFKEWISPAQSIGIRREYETHWSRINAKNAISTLDSALRQFAPAFGVEERISGFSQFVDKAFDNVVSEAVNLKSEGVNIAYVDKISAAITEFGKDRGMTVNLGKLFIREMETSNAIAKLIQPFAKKKAEEAARAKAEEIRKTEFFIRGLKSYKKNLNDKKGHLWLVSVIPVRRGKDIYFRTEFISQAENRIPKKDVTTTIFSDGVHGILDNGIKIELKRDIISFERELEQSYWNPVIRLNDKEIDIQKRTLVDPDIVRVSVNVGIIRDSENFWNKKYTSWKIEIPIADFNMLNDQDWARFKRWNNGQAAASK